MLFLMRLWLLAVACWLAVAALAAPHARIGVLVFQSKTDTRAKWTPTAHWLEQQLPGQRFEVLALNHAELDQAVAQGSVDFVFTNPEHDVVLRNRHLLRPMVTQNVLIQGQVVDQFGSVIVTRANSDITSLEGLSGRTVAAVGRNSLVGFLAAAEVFRQFGVRLDSDERLKLMLTGEPHSAVIQRVLAAQADLGVVRTGVLEQMQAQGQLDLMAPRILNSQDSARFAQHLSTRLYPEWPWAALAQTEPTLVKQVALMQITLDTATAQAGRYQGFAPPANDIGVEAPMRRLDAYPGKDGRPPLLVLWQDHPLVIALLTALLLLGGLGMSAYLWRSNRRLRELTQLNAQAQAGLEVAAAAFDSEVGLVVTDEHTRIKRANPAMTRMLGYEPQALDGKLTRVLRGTSMHKGHLSHVLREVQANGRWQGELVCRHHDGFDVPCMVTVSTIRGSAGQCSYVGSFTDVTAQKQAEADIRRLAYFDPLTQLPNRRMFLEALQNAMDDALCEGTLAGVMFIDLDFFKNLNDAHGHSVGDQLLRLIAQRLTLLIAPKDMAARLGGDEFVVMVPRLDTSESVALDQIMPLAQSIHQALLSPFELDTLGDVAEVAQSLRYTCSGSIGVALFGLMDEPLTEVLKRADVAMYKAKHDGRNLIRTYDPAAQRAVNERMALSNDLNLALRDGQLKLLYQLQVNAKDEAVGAECLMRWQHPQRGHVSPAEFIPLAEDSGAIIAMGDWVVRSACETLAQWAGPGGLGQLTLSVNVSPRQFTEADFVTRVARILHDTGARPQRLRLEVTEGIVMQDTQAVIQRMQALCAMGLSFSIDDFGTGYSSLSYMQMLPLAEIKIDKAFVNDLTSNPRSAAIVKAVIALGNSMDITIVSEGVETQAQKDQLLALGCTLLQGYLITRPIERPDLERLVQERYRPAAVELRR